MSLSLTKPLYHCGLEGFHLGASHFTVGIKAIFKTCNYPKTGIHLKMAQPGSGSALTLRTALLLVEVIIKVSQGVNDGGEKTAESGGD